jgi:hypothetical protein
MRDLLRRLEEAKSPWEKLKQADLRALKRGALSRTEECFLCGLGITATALPKCWWIHLRTDGVLLTQEDEDQQSQGLFVVGPECAKRVPVPYRFRLED